ncbi:MAG: integrin alpha, partial [Actinomycetia bacterium]|nr:integrin alpha [Actinomycetes bacterium]
MISYTIEANDIIHGPPTSEAERAIGANETIDLTEIFTGGNGTFTYSLLNKSLPTGFALAADGTSVEIDTAVAGQGAYLLTVQAEDTDGDTLKQEVTVLLVDYKPSATNVALDDSLTLNASIKRIHFDDAEIAPITIAGLFSGEDGTLTYTLKRDSANADEPDIFAFNDANTKVVIDSTKTAAVLEGDNVVTLVATDADGDTAEQVITVTLTNLTPDAVDVSQDPMLSLTAAIERSDYAAAEIAPIAIEGLFAGGDGGLTYSLKRDTSAADQPDVFALSGDGTQVVIDLTKTAAVLEGNNVVTLMATDEDGDTAQQLITVTLNDLLLRAITPAESGYMSTIQQIDTGNYTDGAPIAPFALDTLFTPGDGEIQYELQGNENSLFKINAGTHVVIDPDKTANAEIGANTVTVVATDIDGDTGQHILTVSISQQNIIDLVPMAVAVADNWKQAGYVRGNIADNDIPAITIAGLFSGGDGTLSYSLVRDSSAIDQPDLFKIVGASTSVAIDPNKAANAREGNNFVTLVATDTDGDSAMQVLTVTLNDLTPTAESGGSVSTSFTRSAFSSAEIVSIAGLFSGGDPTLTYSLERDSSQANEPNAFVIDLAQNKVIIDSTKTANVLEGKNTITLVATDIDGDRATQRLTFSLTDLVPTALTNAVTETAIDDDNFDNAATLEDVVQLSTSGFFSGGDGTLTYSLAGTDTNNDGTYDGIFVLSADNATLRVAGDRLTELAIGENTVIVVATDSDGDAVTQVVTVDVADLDPRALLTPEAIDLRITDGIQNVAIDWFVGGTSSNTLSYSLKNTDNSAYTGDVFVIEPGSLRIAANNLDRGANTVKVVASVGSDSAEVSFTVNAPFTSVDAGEMFALTSSLSQLGAFSHIGDVNNDGYGDVIIGAPASSGRTYVVWGGKEIITADIDLDNMSAEQGFVISGGNKYLGHAVKGGGDVNGDGIGDILVGADNDAGAAYLIWGTEGTRTDLNLSNLAASEGFEILGENGGDRLGHGASLSGDYNNDGYADIVLGARFADPNGVSQAGKSYVIWGHSDDFGTISGTSRTIDLSKMTKTEGFILESNGNADYAGFSVDGSADFNGDGLDDLVIGVFCDSVAHTWAGETLILW